MAMVVVVFPTPLWPTSAPDRWLGGYGAGGVGILKRDFLRSLEQLTLHAVSSIVYNWTLGLDGKPAGPRRRT